MELEFEEGRVIGSLIEKQLTTPQQYPLTLNALVSACNQSSNREPVVSLDERTVETALNQLKGAGFVRFVHPSHGRSVIRYRQVIEERLALDDTELALLGVLLLRGPQTVGELRARTERMATFAGISSVEGELHRMANLPEPLVVRLPRRPGQKEERWAHLLTVGAPEEVSSAVPARWSDSGYQGMDGASSGPPGAPRPTVAAVADDVGALRAEVDELRAELGELRAELGQLRDQLGG